MTPETVPQRLANIVASRPPWFRARLSIIMVSPTTQSALTYLRRKQ